MRTPPGMDRDRDEDGRARNSRPRDELGRPLPIGSVGVERIPEDIMEEVERRINAFRFPLAARPPMSFIAWHDYLADNRGFNSLIPTLSTPAPGSPVQDY